jgi:hypothetical protein
MKLLSRRTDRLKSNVVKPQGREAAERLFIHYRVERACRWMGYIAAVTFVVAIIVVALAAPKHNSTPIWLRDASAEMPLLFSS